jgi:hypothetical protein
MALDALDAKLHVAIGAVSIGGLVAFIAEHARPAARIAHAHRIASVMVGVLCCFSFKWSRKA